MLSQVILRSMGGSIGDPTGMALVSMRLPETPWISEWKKEKLTISYHHHTDSASSNN
jgi:hypothetical protein